MGESKKPSYKYCMVPECENNTKNSPNKVFFRIPSDAKIRKQWCKMVRRDNFSPLSCLYCCEDHFNVKEDTVNYIQYDIMRQQGQKRTLRLKTGVVPHIFLCRKKNMPPPAKRMGVVRRQRLGLVNEALSEFAFKCSDVGSENEASHSAPYTNVSDIYQAGPSTSHVEGNTDEGKSKYEHKEDIPEGRELVVRVYHYLQTEYEQLKQFTGNSCDLSPLANILKRTAAATGLTEHTITLILDEARSDCGEGASDDATPAKRLKMELSFEDEDDRQKDLEDQEQVDSKVEEQMEENDYVPEERLQEQNHYVPKERLKEQNDYVLKTLKFEYEDDDYNLRAAHETADTSLAPHETADTLLVAVKREPVDWDVTDPLHIQYGSLAHETPDTIHVTVKREPEDEE